MPNYPFLKDAQDVVPLNNGKINIAYVGSLEKARGSDFLNGLISVDKDDKVMVHMIGWIYDSDSELLKNQRPKITRPPRFKSDRKDTNNKLLPPIPFLPFEETTLDLSGFISEVIFNKF